MKIIPLIDEITNDFNETFKNNLNPLNLESKIRDIGDLFTLRLYESFLNFFDEQFKNKKERKEKYNIKETRRRTLITSIGVININSTSYIDKETKEYYVPLRDILHLKPYQRLTNEAEYQLVKYSMEENMSQASKHALRNTIVSRSTVSKKIKVLDGSIIENITKSVNQPDILYVEMDEIHANLQHGGNKICPCAIVHEGYEEDLLKEKSLKIFAILLLLNYHMKNFGKLSLTMLIKNMILINLKLYLYLAMVLQALKTMKTAFLMLNSYLILSTI